MEVLYWFLCSSVAESSELLGMLDRSPQPSMNNISVSHLLAIHACMNDAHLIWYTYCECEHA